MGVLGCFLVIYVGVVCCLMFFLYDTPRARERRKSSIMRHCNRSCSNCKHYDSTTGCCVQTIPSKREWDNVTGYHMTLEHNVARIAARTVGTHNCHWAKRK